MENKLEQYFNFFNENSGVENWSWYKEMQIWIKILQDIKKDINITKIDTLNEFNLYLAEKSNQKIIDTDAFLDRYLFMQDNGTANIGQGFIYEKHRIIIRDKIKNNYILLVNILLNTDTYQTSQLIEDLVNIEKNYKAVRFRFLKTLFPNNFTSVEAEGKFYRLLNILNKKLSIKISGDDTISKHNALMLELKNIDEPVYKKHIFYWELYYMLDNDLDLKKAIVYYGAPGTGKTYKAKFEAKNFIDSWALKTFTTDKKYLIETVQFHPSYAYEDFIEGIRPSKDKELKLKPGVFKKFCKKASEVEIKLYKNTDFLKKFKDKDFTDITVLDVRKVQGIENILPNINNIADGLTLQDIIEPAFFIIDEINRAELSRVFGELMYSLEYRGYNGKIKTQYSYLNEDENDENIFFWENGEDWFFIPQNVYIIGTMNTIDRSVDSFDFALRRRFMWEEILPNYNVIKVELDRTLADKKNLGIELSKSFQKLNNMIKNNELLGSDYQIGHSYALNIKHKSFEKIRDAKYFLWQEFIKPLVQEYLRGLGDSKKSNEILESFQKEFGAS
jgi:5-methylcytosine-specific restriction protein B